MSTDLHHELIERCREGDLRAQHRLFNLYIRAMYNTVMRIIPNKMEAEDVVQEAFVKAFQGLEGFRGESSFGHWLKRIMVNTALNTLKKQSRDLLIMSEQIEEQAEMPEPALAQMPEPAVVHEAIKSLPDGCRVIFSLHQLEGYEQREVADTLGVSVSTVKTQYRRARLLLKQRLMNTQHE